MEIIRIAGAAAVLLGKAPALLIWLLYQRRAGLRAFRRQLLQAGIRPDHADELTAVYRSLLLPSWKQWRQLVSQRSQISSPPLLLHEPGLQHPSKRHLPIRQPTLEPVAQTKTEPIVQRSSRGLTFRFNDAETDRPINAR
jgi:hypothetical protein